MATAFGAGSARSAALIPIVIMMVPTGARAQGMDMRPPIVTLSSPAQDRPAGPPPMDSAMLLKPADRTNLPAARIRAWQTMAGDFDLTLFTSHFKGARIEGGMSVPVRARYGIRTVGIDMGRDLTGGLRLQADAMLTLIKPHLALRPGLTHMPGTRIETLGLGVVRPGGFSLRLDYLRVGSGRYRSALDRIEALGDGAPLPGNGLRLAFLDHADESRPGHVQWGLALSSLRRPLMDLATGADARTEMDRRAELTLRMAF